MQPDVLLESTRLDLLRRLKESASTSSLTLMSIVQGVALADLAGVVSSNYTRFLPAQWVLVVPSFLLILAAWNQVTMDTITWVQLPNMVGSLIPFFVGGFELFLNHALSHSPLAWFIGAAVIIMLSTVGINFVERNVAMHPENAQLMAYLRKYRLAGQRYNLGGTALLVALAVASVLGGFAWLDGLTHQPNLTNVIAGLLVCGFLLGFIARHFFYWRVVTAYAQAQPAPTKGHKG